MAPPRAGCGENYDLRELKVGRGRFLGRPITCSLLDAFLGEPFQNKLLRRSQRDALSVREGVQKFRGEGGFYTH